MKFHDDQTMPLPLVGGVVQRQVLLVPHEVLRSLPTYRHACRLAWRLRVVRNLSRTALAQAVPGLYLSHVSDYFSAHAQRRELPARHVPDVERVLGNKVITQWLVHRGEGTLLEEVLADRVQQQLVVGRRAA